MMDSWDPSRGHFWAAFGAMVIIGMLHALTLACVEHSFTLALMERLQEELKGKKALTLSMIRIEEPNQQRLAL